MKNYIILSILMCLALPVFAVCSITGGACTATSNFDDKPLEDRLIPDHLQEIQRTDAFQPNYITPYRDALINIGEAESTTVQGNNYNSNCQFGVCLPGAEPGEEILE